MLSLGIVTTSLSRKAGGLFHSVRQSALALRSAGIDVSVYGVEDAFTADDLGAWMPLEPQVFPRMGPSGLGIGRGLGRALRYGGHDVIHLHGIWQYASYAALNSGVPVMISPRGMLDPWATANSGWKKSLAGLLFERRNLREAACLHALNASEQEAMRAFGLRGPIACIPNGTVLPSLDSMPERPHWLPPDMKRTLLFLGRIHPKKGLTELLEAWRQLQDRDRAHGWRLVIAGWDDGGHEAALKSAASAYGFDNVFFPGPLFDEDKHAALAHADAFILPSHSEGLPMAILEAWAYRLPVLMTDACNLPEGFDAGAARRIETAPGPMADSLAANLTDATLADVGDNGQRLVAERFSWTPIVQQHIDVYRWMISGGPPPSVIERRKTGIAAEGS